MVMLHHQDILPQVDTVLQLKGIRRPRKYCHKRKLSAAHDREPAVNMVSSAAFEIEDSGKERAVRIELSNGLGKHSNMQRALRTTSWSKNRLY
jgi:hypothetical protein